MKNLKKLAVTAGLVFGLAVATPAFAATNYTVQSGDTVAKIAYKEGVTSNSIIKVNDITNIYNIQIGQVMVIPSIAQGKVIDKAFTLLGTTPYVFGGTTPYVGLDCSGFTQWSYAQTGVSILRTAQLQWDNNGTFVPANQLQPGDLVFFTGTDSARPDILATHVGIYVGKGNFIEASSTYNNIVEKPLWGGYYEQHYLGAKRIVN